MADTADRSRNEGLDAELARRLQAALTADHAGLFAILQAPAPEVLRAALRNRHLGEEHLLALLKRRDLPEDLPKAIAGLAVYRESHRVKVALAMNPATPGPLLSSLLPHIYLFELLNLCILPGTTPDQRVAAERVILQRLPTVELGHKLTLARRGTPPLLDALLREGEPHLVEACLTSPRLREASLLQFLNGPTPSAETISMIARHPRWKARPNLRLAILKNRKTPQVWFTLFLPALRVPDLNNLLAGRRLTTVQKQLVTTELKRRGSL